MIQALENFVGEPLRHRRFDLAWYRISQLLHDRTNGGYDAFYMRLARIFRPKVLLPELPPAQRDEIKDVVDRLRRDGYMILPELLPAQDVEEIKNFAFSTPGIRQRSQQEDANLCRQYSRRTSEISLVDGRTREGSGDTTFNRGRPVLRDRARIPWLSANSRSRHLVSGSSICREV